MKNLIFITLSILIFLTACGTPIPQPTLDTAGGLLTYRYWEAVGDSVSTPSGTGVSNPSIVMASGQPVVSWDELDNSTNRSVFAKHWNGTDWVALSSTVDISRAKHARNAQLLVNPRGNPSIAFEEGDTIFLRHWNGSDWITDTSLWRFAHSGQRHPRVAYDETGKAWGTIANGVVTTDLYHAYYGGPEWSRPEIVAYAHEALVAVAVSFESDRRNTNIKVVHHPWTAPGPLGEINGHPPLDINESKAAYLPKIALNTRDQPIVSWIEDGDSSSNLYVKHWNGIRWDSLGGALDVNLDNHVISQSLAVDDFGNPVVAWEEAGLIHQIYVKRWNGTDWELLAGPIDEDNSYSPAVTIANNVPYVAFAKGQNKTLHVKRFVKRQVALLEINPCLYKPNACGIVPVKIFPDPCPDCLFKIDLEEKGVYRFQFSLSALNLNLEAFAQAFNFRILNTNGDVLAIASNLQQESVLELSAELNKGSYLLQIEVDETLKEQMGSNPYELNISFQP